jgi:hypothetical protein
MTYNLFIDDERDPHEVTWVGSSAYQSGDWVIARSATEVEQILAALGLPKLISFDHDLGDGLSGYDIAKHIGDLLLQDCHSVLPRIYIHSKNPVGAENIRCYMEAIFNEHSKTR